MRELKHVQLLDLMYDRTIPDAALRAARELDRQGVPTGVMWSAPEPPAPRSAIATVARMARVMIDRSTASGACTDQDLIAAGFTKEEIDSHRLAAAALAARLTADRVREKIKAAKARRKGGKHAVVA
ncbi:MAG TPA: hypothetical protein VGL83_13585 [Stellaceae bacterium]|jgi:hypothetical protein